MKKKKKVKVKMWVCDGGSCGHGVCPNKGKLVPKCDGGCMYAGA